MSDTTTRVGDAYDKSAGNYNAAMFNPIGRKVVDLLDLGRGERVLDIGCGRGACLFPAADAVGPTGHVLGIDLSAEMAARCAEDAAASPFRDWVEVRQGDIQRLALDEPVDAVTAGMVLFLLPDPADALRRIAAVLRPGGRFAATTFPTQDGGLAAGWESAEIIADVLGGYLPAGVDNPWTPVLGVGGPLADAESTAAAVRAAGFSEVEVGTVDAVSHFDSVDAYITWTWNITTRMLWDLVPADRLAEATAQARERLAVIAGADGAVDFVCPTRTIHAVR
ncbi:methyltransferase domain-containing protein [Actinokineospora auranticolor]|uniref:Ubiquinone/menaquinone biosynthesis C-methylase UbiE n=1 Tax=Actinokineospora auranticolor TaxID=155976 RepID=A0A2S6GPI9_9PSEU|nr:methyltransferase domain-containing protein [Actinokineospora auranticolor]PPK67090.1 ubiquinone/menaquinone biosynthesis C-methylase UbiE [Actinokineospora auranticolor]